MTRLSDHSIYAEKLTPDGQLVHFSGAAEYGAQHGIAVVVLHREVICTAVGAVKSGCLSRYRGI